MPDCPYLDDCAVRYAAARDDLESLRSAVDERQANWPPGDGRWSVAECVDHLNVTVRGYLPRMQTAIEGARGRGLVGQAPYPQRSFLGRMILHTLDPTANRTFRAPKVFRPAAGPHDFDQVCAGLGSGIDCLVELADLADGLALGRIRLASPAAPVPRLTLAEAFEIHALHIPRHLAQARAVLTAPGFPAS